jgi:hypothetical protein
MLGLMLASGNDAVSCGEACAWFRVARHRPGATVPAAYDLLRDVDERSFHRRLMAQHGVRFAVDSSKDVDWVIDHTRWADQSGLRVFNLLIHKSPVDIALSWWKRNEYHRWYRYYLRYHLQFLCSGLDFWTVSYDDLVAKPGSTLRTICRLTGLPYFEGKEQFWKYEHELLGTNSRGVRSQLGQGQSTIQKPPIPDAFRSLANQVQARAATDRLLARLRGALDRRRIPLEAHTPTTPHEYRPTLVSGLLYRAYRTVKLPWGRFRWNVLEPQIRRFAPSAGDAPKLPSR